MKKVLVIDTSILCVWLSIPGFETCGSQEDKWDKPRADRKINDETTNNSLLVLPLATIIETGNHISHAPHSRKVYAEALGKLLRMTADGRTPWAVLSEQDQLWSKDSVVKLSREWPILAERRLSIGDAAIKAAAEFYSAMGCTVEILTGDSQLKSFEPAEPAEQPRRRK